MEHMLSPKASRKVPMLPGPLEMKSRMLTSPVVSDPSSIVMHVGRLGVPRHIVEPAVFHFAMPFRDAMLWHLRAGRRRSVRRNESAAGPTTLTTPASFLRHGRQSRNHQHCKQDARYFHRTRDLHHSG